MKKHFIKILCASSLVLALSACSTDEIAETPSGLSNVDKETEANTVYSSGPFTPPLTSLGNTAMCCMTSFQRRERANALLNGFENINTYITGICYEAVAFARFMYDGAITADDLTNFRAQGWLARFNFHQGRQWDGNFALAGGEIIGFRDESTEAYFHAAIATGEYDRVRGVNGYTLGNGWQNPVSLRIILGSRNYDGTFNYEGRKIRVFISNI